MFYIFCNFLIVYFIFFVTFWPSGCDHRVVIFLLVQIKPKIMYLGLWHTWSVFSSPLKNNRKILLNVEYENLEEEIINLFDYEKMIFFNRTANTFDTKYVENLFSFIKVRSDFIYFAKNFIEKNENKKVKKIEFIGQFDEMKLCDYSLDPYLVMITSYSF